MEKKKFSGPVAMQEGLEYGALGVQGRHHPEEWLCRGQARRDLCDGSFAFRPREGRRPSPSALEEICEGCGHPIAAAKLIPS